MRLVIIDYGMGNLYSLKSTIEHLGSSDVTISNNISVTARYIINNSDIPVMSIRPKEVKHITGPTTAF